MKRKIRTAFFVLAAIGALVAFIVTGAAYPASASIVPAGTTAAAAHHPEARQLARLRAEVRSLRRAIVTGQSVGIDGRTYRARRVHHGRPVCGHPRREHDAGALRWSFANRAMARYLGIAPCSIVVSGRGHSVILTRPPASPELPRRVAWRAGHSPARRVARLGLRERGDAPMPEDLVIGMPVSDWDHLLAALVRDQEEHGPDADRDRITTFVEGVIMDHAAGPPLTGAAER